MIFRCERERKSKGDAKKKREKQTIDQLVCEASHRERERSRLASKRAASAVLSMIPPALTIENRAANASAVKDEADLIASR
jgi:hypothetical protein